MTFAIQLIQDLAVILLSAAGAGWLCRKLNISKVVGYLVVGIVIGTPQITFIYVTNAERVHTLSQLGLVFLMFFVGLQFRISRLRELGFGVVIATVITATITLTTTRLAASALGYSEGESLFLAGMLVVSSSAIISRVLEEYQLNHSRAGQLAMGVTLLEDMVAIVMLAWLGAYGATESNASSAAPWIPLAKSIGLLAAFVAVVAIPGLLFIPKVLKKLGREGESELETLLVAGLLFFTAYLTVSSGFSLALGAFLCGVIISEAARARAISVNFTGLKDVFVTVFFTAIGMSIDVARFPDALPLILLGVGLAMFVRVIGATVGFILASENENTALRAGLCLTPIGEFSFVIASLGISTGAVGNDFQIAAVGISFLTSLLSPALIKQSDRIADLLGPSRFTPLQKALRMYQSIWENFDKRRKRNMLARLVAPRLWQIGREILLVTGILIFAQPGYVILIDWIQTNHPELEPYTLLYWLAIFLVCLFPIVALVRNGNALSLIIGEYFIGIQHDRAALRLSFVYLLRIFGMSIAGIWIANFIPVQFLNIYALVGLLAIAFISAVAGWRILARSYSHVEVALEHTLQKPADESVARSRLKEASKDWGVQLTEFAIPDDSRFAGATISSTELRATTGCSIVGIERQGFQLTSIGPDTHLFPADVLFLVGNQTSLRKARDLLSESASTSTSLGLSSAVLDQITIFADSQWAGKSLASLQWPRLYGVQVVGAQRDGVPRLSPDPDWRIAVGDRLLIAGPQSAVNALRSS